jgi:cytoskeleton protein RodZ
MTLERGEAVPPVPNAATPEAALQSPGALLQQERIRRGLSVQQAAETLHLDSWIIEAIEANNFLALGAPVYARGYLKKYAVMLGLAPEVVVSRYEALTDTPVEPTPTPTGTAPPPRPKWPKYVVWAVIAAVVIGLTIVVFEVLVPVARRVLAARSDAPVVAAPVSTPPAVAAPAVTPSVEAQTQVQTAVAPPPSAQAPAQTKRAESVPAQATSAPEPTSAATGSPVRLRLEFKEASWAEVYDATGQRLLYDVGQPNRPRVVSGVAPLNVVVGIASAVSVQVNDQAIVVPRRANKDSTRFSVSADGSVQ